MPHGRAHPQLPIFRLDVDGTDRSIFYVPRHIVGLRRSQADALEHAFGDGERSCGDDLASLAGALESRAHDAVREWKQLSERPFSPECLTLYFSNYCNLGCNYCYAAAEDGSRVSPRLAGPERRSLPQPRLPILEPRVIAAAAEVVARHCSEKRKPFTLVLHGGGEPTVHWELLQGAVASTREVSRRHGVPWFGYIATNGFVAEEQARWLGEHFDRVGLSCDGPPDIQDAQRPADGNRVTSAAVERTARVLASTLAEVSVRVTITPATVDRQSDIVRYVKRTLLATDIRLEPVYLGGGVRQPALEPDHAPEFVRHFLAAERVAGELGCQLSIAGVRLDEIHGPYCNVLRDVVHLTPDGAATACFLCTDSRQGKDATLAIGHKDPTQGEFVIDQARVAVMRRRATRVPERCQDCLNVYHCARDCPDICPVLGEEDVPGRPGGFRCRVQKQLGETWVRRLAGDRHLADSAPDTEPLMP